MFHHARIKLTLWYLLIIMTISMSFSVVIFTMLKSEVERFARFQRVRIERQYTGNFPLHTEIDNQPMPPVIDTDLMLEMERRILLILLLINGGIALLSGMLGYLLAGKTLRPIQEMMDEQNQFITDASHELRTPLTALRSTIEVNIRDPKFTLPRAKKLLKENIEDVNRLTLLSDQLLTLAQYQKPNGITPMKQCSVMGAFHDAEKRIDAMRKAKSIRITNASTDAFVLGHIQELTDLFIILLDNAIKYSPKKSTIRISSIIKNNWVSLCVTDQGIGIIKKDIPHIFDRFYRGDSARSRGGTDGYGLGLAIAKNIVEAHHGTIYCESTIGKGSTFTVRFPIAE